MFHFVHHMSTIHFHFYNLPVLSTIFLFIFSMRLKFSIEVKIDQKNADTKQFIKPKKHNLRLFKIQQKNGEQNCKLRIWNYWMFKCDEQDIYNTEDFSNNLLQSESNKNQKSHFFQFHFYLQLNFSLVI